MFRKHPNINQIHDYETSVTTHAHNVGHIKRSFEALDLNSERATLVGGAALRLHGGIKRHNAADLDIVVPAGDLLQFDRDGLSSPYVESVSRGHEATAENGSQGTTSLRVKTVGRLLDADLITRFNPGETTLEEYDARFDKIVDFVVIDGIRVASLLYLLDEYSKRGGEKAAHDRSVALGILASRGINGKKALKDYRRTKR